jgi:hypothetical protein
MLSTVAQDHLIDHRIDWADAARATVASLLVVQEAPSQLQFEQEHRLGVAAAPSTGALRTSLSSPSASGHSSPRHAQPADFANGLRNSRDSTPPQSHRIPPLRAAIQGRLRGALPRILPGLPKPPFPLQPLNMKLNPPASASTPCTPVPAPEGSLAHRVRP